MGNVKGDRVIIPYRVTLQEFTDEVKGYLGKTVYGREQQDHKL